MATPPTAFHVAIASPPGMSFPSFPSSAIEGGDPKKITLDMIRNKCGISNKLFFTVDGKSRIQDNITLEYYMSLSAEGHKLLKPPAIDAAAAAGVPTFTINLGDSTEKRDLVGLPSNNEALTKLLDGISKNTLDKGTLPTFADRALVGLTTSYATQLGAGRTYAYTEPNELTEAQWDAVLRNNRAFHGYYYDFALSTLMQAPKPDMNTISALISGAPKQQYLPPLPPFYVHDRAGVKVTEVRSQQQSTWIKEGFNSEAVGGSLGGGPSTVPVSIQASWEQEHSYANQRRQVTDVDSLAVTYNFPRAVIEFDPSTLELTDQCRREALNLTNQEAVEQFRRNYGTIFATRLTLGGYLYSTRNVKSTETATLDQVKDRTRIAAGISVQTPWASGSLNFAKVNQTSTDTGRASLDQEVYLTWDAHGGDTLLVTNPPAWASTVKDHRLWRLMNKERIVSLPAIIKAIDTEAYKQITNPSPAAPFANANILTDERFQDYVRNAIMDAVGPKAGADNAVARKMADYYIVDTANRITACNAFMKKNFPEDEDGIIPAGGRLWGGLTVDQKVAWGLWMTGQGALTWAGWST